MAHYAFLDENSIVTEVIVGIDETELIDGKAPEQWYSEFRGQTCIRTSYNGRIRFNYAGIGYTYDAVNDVFIPPQPFASWVLNSSWLWEAPVPHPDDGKQYGWDESVTNWVEVPTTDKE